MIDVSGGEHFSEDEKGKIGVDYFSKLFESTQPRDSCELLEGMETKVTAGMNRLLTRPDSEINKVVKAIKGSTPGIDGTTKKFFHNYWNITGPQVTKEVKDFLSNGLLPLEWNFTQLCLLPKKLNPNQMAVSVQWSTRSSLLSCLQDEKLFYLS